MHTITGKTGRIITLDAVGPFDFYKININGRPTGYNHNGQTLVMSPGVTFSSNDTFSVEIKYSVVPVNTANLASGIGNNGLYFVDSSQIWTHGETQNLSHWLPCHEDGDKWTSVIRVKIPDAMLTISNGLMTNSEKIGNDQRIDTWVSDEPLPAYLYALVVGKFSVTTERWGPTAEYGTPITVEYYVDPQYANYATDIFPQTKEILSFFTNLVGINYPFPSYRQIVVRLFFTGAMENPGCTIFGDVYQRTTGELDSDPVFNLNVIAHEIAHSFFGNYVTPFGWENTALSEGFSNFLPYLFFEQYLGKGSTDEIRKKDKEAYIRSTVAGTHPLIDTALANKDPELMFDKVSYNKGGAILWMLYKHLGHEVFFAGVHSYLTEHAYDYVVWQDLQLAMEKASGEDLKWFFDAWFLQTGHPILNVNQVITGNRVHLDIKQIQEEKGWKNFPFNLKIKVYTENGVYTQTTFIKDKNLSIDLGFDADVKAVVIDPEGDLLTEIHMNATVSDFREIALNTEDLCGRLVACDSLVAHINEVNNINILVWKLLRMTEPQLRSQGVRMAPKTDSTWVKNLVWIAQNDTTNYVRRDALNWFKGPVYENLFLDRWINDSSLMVRTLGLRKLNEINHLQALEIAKDEWQKIQAGHLHQRYTTFALATIFATEGGVQFQDYFLDVIGRANRYALFELDQPTSMISWLKTLSEPERKSFLEKIDLNTFPGVKRTFGK